ncbi:MAG TPA: TlpA disulfide reductase family protein [Phototrophicaceae bacterium]|nr:TlpA disulfide reductase family protein [Phototrophicaceae bacterium]
MIGDANISARETASFTRRTLIGASAAFGLFAEAARAQQSFDVAAYAGKVLYLDFWASWCGPCQLSFPYMRHLLTTYGQTDFALTAINVDHDRASANAFLQRFGAGVPIVFDPSGSIARRYQVKSMPTSILFGRDGRARFVHDGFNASDISTYDNHILELLHES